MEAVYLDLHIHTSENEDSLNQNYNVDLLLEKIKETSDNATFLISLTDHNTINKLAYIKLLEKTNNIILGVELHIKNAESKPPYHCHIYFDLDEITEEIIDKINVILNELYPVKQITPETNVSNIETIIRKFDEFDFLLLPHGGQSHRTFDKSVDSNFNTRLEKSIYYNQFDGFTARNQRGLDDTINYFKRLGINEFVNLITCTDNYSPNVYPQSKSYEASDFIPTWMLAKPTFSGLQLSLSESSRLVYASEAPDIWSEYIQEVKLLNDNIDINVNLTPGLNVVIGGSSSGKTLFVDTIVRKLSNDLTSGAYTDFGIDEIYINYPAQSKPHYISQNYIMKVLGSNGENRIDEIEIIKNVFPNEQSVIDTINSGLSELKNDITDLIKFVKNIETSEREIERTSVLSSLILNSDVKNNILELIYPKEEVIEKINYTEHVYKQQLENLKDIESVIINNPFVEFHKNEFEIIEKKLIQAFNMSKFEYQIRAKIKLGKDELKEYFLQENLESQTKQNQFDQLLNSIKTYTKNLLKFKNKLIEIQDYAISVETNTVESMGHTLSIENTFVLNENKFIEIINKYLKTGHKIENIEHLKPQNLYFENFSQRNPKVNDYNDFENKIYNEFVKLNKQNYKIITKDGKDFNRLSAGWKTSVILDLILGYENDIAPLIIDQPEDNLATNYINHGLIESIKKIKQKKQIIIVSHNATIPMLGDAQNIILCENNEGLIRITSNPLEGYINTKGVVDYVAEITDGGKPSIRKRVKKYNMKKFKENT